MIVNERMGKYTPQTKHTQWKTKKKEMKMKKERKRTEIHRINLGKGADPHKKI